MGGLLGFGAFVGVGVLFAGFGVWSLLRDRRLAQRAVRVGGVVVALERRPLVGGGSLPFPVVEFTTADGRRLHFRSDSASRFDPYAVGQPVAVLYDPADPQQARIDSGTLRWVLPAMFIAIGGGLLVMASCVLLVFLVS